MNAGTLRQRIHDMREKSRGKRRERERERGGGGGRVGGRQRRKWAQVEMKRQ